MDPNTSIGDTRALSLHPTPFPKMPYLELTPCNTLPHGSVLTLERDCARGTAFLDDAAQMIGEVICDAPPSRTRATVIGNVVVPDP